MPNKLIIDGMPMPSYTSLEVGIDDLDSEGTGRNELGVNQRDRIREGVRVAQFSWVHLTQSESLVLLQNTKNAELTVTYLDPEYGLVTKSMYASPKRTKLVYDAEGEQKWNIDFSLIEN